jgi:hypothetical protein
MSVALTPPRSVSPFQGATYFAEAQYVTPHEYAWCRSHPGECDKCNNASYRQYSVTGITNFTFSRVGPTVRTHLQFRPGRAQMALAGIEPDPGNDGFGLLAYKVTNPSTGGGIIVRRL